jgi:hypothetical protein
MVGRYVPQGSNSHRWRLRMDGRYVPQGSNSHRWGLRMVGYVPQGSNTVIGGSGEWMEDMYHKGLIVIGGT